MSRTLSVAAIKSQNVENTEEVWLARLSIRHTSITGDLIITNNEFQERDKNWLSSAGAVLTYWSFDGRYATNLLTASRTLYMDSLEPLKVGDVVQVIAKIGAASGGSIYPVVANVAGTGVAAATAANSTQIWTFTISTITDQKVGIQLDAPTASGWQIESLDIRKVGAIRLVNDRQDLVCGPAQVLSAANSDPTQWTKTGTGTVTSYGTLDELADTDAAAQTKFEFVQGSLTVAAVMTYMLRVRKDAVGKATRFPRIHVIDGSGQTEFYFDTSTGEGALGATTGNHVAAGILDDGDAWRVYITRTVPAGASFTIGLYPAYGANATLGTSSNAAQGSVQVERPCLYTGRINDRMVYVAFPFQIDLPGEDVEQPSVARLRIDNVDRRIVQAIRGLPTAPLADIEVVLASQPETVEVGFYDLTLRAADYDALYVEGTLTFEQIFTEPLSVEMTPARFPGMF